MSILCDYELFPVDLECIQEQTPSSWDSLGQQEKTHKTDKMNIIWCYRPN